MDKKSIFLGFVLLGAAFVMMFWQGKQYDTFDEKEENGQVVAEEVVSPVQKKKALSRTSKAGSKEASLFETVKPIAVEEIKPSGLEQIVELENDYIKASFTTEGGGIKTIALKKYPDSLGSKNPFIFNEISPDSALGLGSMNANGDLKEYALQYRIVSKTDASVLFEAVSPEGVKIYRGYSISKDEKKRDPYLILHETRFDNQSDSAFNLRKIYVNLGSFPPTQGDSYGEYLNVGYYNGKKAQFIKSSRFGGSKGFFGIGAKPAVDEIEEPVKNLVWASVKNQFFASVLTPHEPANGIYAKPFDYGSDDGEALTGSLEIELGQILPGEEHLVGLEFYVGPKEYTRLEQLGENQDLIMQFGFFGMISKLLLIVMTGVNKFIPNWGLTIIVVTIIIKLILWPLTAVQVRSSKRMAKIQKPLQEIREKYKGNSQKIQMETMKLFKENRVNPAAGCLPLFVQLPIFLGLYFMLRTASDLRFASFLWIPDLSVPDTVAHIAGFPINILPLLMGVSMFWQMKSTPSPMTDNMQRRIFQLMPFIFLVFCYNFPSGLVLYWTVQNLLTIAQQKITNRMKDPVVDLPSPQADKGKKDKKKGPKKTR